MDSVSENRVPVRICAEGIEDFWIDLERELGAQEVAELFRAGQFGRWSRLSQHDGSSTTRQKTATSTVPAPASAAQGTRRRPGGGGLPRRPPRSEGREAH